MASEKNKENGPNSTNAEEKNLVPPSLISQSLLTHTSSVTNTENSLLNSYLTAAKQEGNGLLAASGNQKAGSQLFKVRWKEHSNRLEEFVSSLYKDTNSSDLRLVTKEADFVPAHRLVMAGASPYFRKVLQVSLTSTVK